MKKVVFAILGVLLFFSCEREPAKIDQPTSKDLVELFSASAMAVDAEGGSVTISFTASSDWTVSPSNDRASWLSIDPSSGPAGSATVKVTVDPNETPDERSATLRVKSGSATASVTITQKQKDALTMTPSKTQFGPEGGSFTIEVKSNIEYSFEIGASWIHQSATKALTSTTTTFTVDENEDTRKREGTVIIKSSLGSETITVYQEASSPSIVLSSENVALGTEGGTFTVDVNTNVDVSMAITAGAEWLSEVSTKAMSTHSYTFQAAANESTDSREGKITFKNTASGVEATVTVTQMPKEALVISQALYEIGAEGGSISIEASTNVELDVAVSAPWVRQITTKSMEKVTYNFDVEANAGYNERECQITFSGGEEISVFSQPSPWSLIGTMYGDSWTIDIAMKTDGKYHVVRGVTFTASDEFKFRKDQAWSENFGSINFQGATLPADVLVNLSQDGGNFKIAAGTYDFYLSPDDRKAYFLTAGTPFSFDGYDDVPQRLSQTVMVRQDGSDGFLPDFKDQYTVSSSAQMIELRSRSSVEVEAEPKCDWITVVSTKALSNRPVTLQIAENTSATSRTGEVVVSAPALGESRTVTITQKAAGEMYIPDEAFYAWLLGRFDADGNGVLSESECGAVKAIELSLSGDLDIKSVAGLEYFPNLYRLDVTWTPAEGASELTEIVISGNPRLSELRLTNLSQLKTLSLDCPNLNVLDVNRCPALSGADLSKFDKLQSISLHNCPWLTVLDCTYNPDLSSLIVGSCPALTKIIAPCPKLSNLNIQDCLALDYSDIILPQEDFDLSYIYVDTIASFPEEIDLSMCPGLRSICFSSRADYWNISTIWLRTGVTLGQVAGFAKYAELLYKGDDVLLPVQFQSTAFRDFILKANKYYDINEDGELSDYELSKIDYLVVFSSWFTLDETITTLEDIGHLRNLKHFGMIGFGDKVSAPIPEALRTLEKLESFSLDDCRIQGTLPGWLAEMPALTEVTLEGSYPLGGEIPAAILTCDKWEYLDLSGCAFTGASFVVPAASLLDYGSEYYNAYYSGRFIFTPQHETVRRETQAGGDYAYDYPNILYQSDVDGTGAVHPDGEAVLYHAATKGPGIDLIITGDGFTAENNTVGGTLETYMTACAETFLDTDPYDKLAEYYNVWFVYAHSRTAGTGVLNGYCTKFGARHENPPYESTISGNNADVVAFMNSALGKDCSNAVIGVLMNSSTYGGTCHSSYYSLNSWVYTVAYTPVHPDYGGFLPTFVHETLGHGIGKLADEYNADMANPGSVPSTYPYWTTLGMYANVDNVSDPATIRWHNFLSDARYAGEGLGVFEGAFYANSGWYRPSDNSVMRNQFEEGGGRFKAPSREAIYQWTLFRAYGGGREWADWPSFLDEYYDYETFVALDKTPSPSPARRQVHKARRTPEKTVLHDGRVIENKRPPLAPPVIVNLPDDR